MSLFLQASSRQLPPSLSSSLFLAACAKTPLEPLMKNEIWACYSLKNFCKTLPLKSINLGQLQNLTKVTQYPSGCFGWPHVTQCQKHPSNNNQVLQA